MNTHLLVKNAAGLTSTVTDVVGDALASGSHLARDLASTAAERAADVAGTIGATAGSVVAHTPELSDRVLELVDTARRHRRPSMARRLRPLLFVAAAIAVVAAVRWWKRRTTRYEPFVDQGPGEAPNPVREHSERAAAAASA